MTPILVYTKNSFISSILEQASTVYLDRLDAIALDPSNVFGSLQDLIQIHFSVMADEPECMRILLRTCPARLEDPAGTCAQVYREARARLSALLREILHLGMASGEFVRVDVDATANMLIALVNGLMRQQIAAKGALEGVESATIDFCRQALMGPGEPPVSREAAKNANGRSLM